MNKYNNAVVYKIYNKLNPWVLNDSNERVKITQVEVREHEKNTALYIPAL